MPCLVWCRKFSPILLLYIVYGNQSADRRGCCYKWAFAPDNCSDYGRVGEVQSCDINLKEKRKNFKKCSLVRAISVKITSVD